LYAYRPECTGDVTTPTGTAEWTKHQALVSPDSAVAVKSVPTAGVADALGVGMSVGIGVAVTVGLGVGLAVLVGVGVGVNVGRGVGVAVAVGVGLGHR
jgi:hypothetical protein